jgi:hypothetical protein
MRPLAILPCFCLLLFAAALPPAARADVLVELDACASVLEPDIDVGFERIAARCPELARDLTVSDWAAWLPQDWAAADSYLSAPGLRALHRLVVRERALRGPAWRPDVAELRPILARLAAPDAAAPGWWARFQNWLRARLAQSEEDSQTSGWGGYIGRLPLSQTLLAAVSYTTLACVVLLAGFIVVNEYRVSGRRRRAPRAPSANAACPGAVAPLDWEDIERAALPERPRMLLTLIAARLTAVRRLPAAAGLTARELARAAQLEDAADQERLIEVALASERLRFSDEEPETASLSAVLQRGRELLERLNAAAALA